jgi:hypothetical protein
MLTFSQDGAASVGIREIHTGDSDQNDDPSTAIFQDEGTHAGSTAHVNLYGVWLRHCKDSLHQVQAPTSAPLALETSWSTQVLVGMKHS